MFLERPADNLPLVFGYPVPKIRESERREIAYALFLWACLYFGSRVKKALDLKTGFETGRKRILEATSKQFVAVQMGISNERHTRLNKALQRISDDSRGRPMESVVLPLELIQQFSPLDFPSEQEYEDCLKRNLKVLGAVHPRADTSEGREQINEMINEACENPIAFKDSRKMQALRDVLLGASRASNGSPSETCNWAQRFPMNVWFYQTLLGACFDLDEKTFVIEDVDELMELLKRTWVMLGVNEMVHSICFSLVLLRQYVTTGQVENDLLAASCNLLAEVKSNTKAVENPLYRNAVNSALTLISIWANKKVLASHEDNMESMEGIISLAVLSAEILEECNPQSKNAALASTRVKNNMKSYIRRSLHTALAKMSKEHNPSKHPSRKQVEVLRDFSAFVIDVIDLAFCKEEKFSPKLRKWHPLVAGVVATTLYEIYGNKLKKCVERITTLTPLAIEVLLAAGELEKYLTKMAEEDSIDSEDGGKPINAEMRPYKAEAALAKLVKSWIHVTVDGMEEWVAKVLRPEVWNLQPNEDGCIPSAADVLKVIRDTLEEFFSLPIPVHAFFLPDLISGLDNPLQQYILKATFGYGNRDNFIPAKPPLTRHSAGSKSRDAILKKKKLQSDQRSKAQVGNTSADDSFGILRQRQLYDRINTLEIISQALKDLEKQILEKPRSSKSTVVSFKFVLSFDAACQGILQLCECIAYKVVFQDLRHVLWDGLYVGKVPSTRIGPFLQELKKCLEIIALTPMRDKVKEHIFTTVLKASFDGFLLVLLAGGPSRAFSLEDCTLIEQDFESLIELFRCFGNEFRSEFIEAPSAIVRAVLSLFGTKTEDIIRKFNQLTEGMYDSPVQSGLQLPPASDQWSPEEPDTLLRVLCYRDEKAASKFLKHLGLPKNV